MSKDVEFADWISDLNDLYATAGEAEILAKVKEYRAAVAHELAELQRLRMDELDLTGQKARIVGRIVDLIDQEVPGG
jgi:hypothetical protein